MNPRRQVKGHRPVLQHLAQTRGILQQARRESADSIQPGAPYIADIERASTCCACPPPCEDKIQVQSLHASCRAHLQPGLRPALRTPREDHRRRTCHPPRSGRRSPLHGNQRPRKRRRSRAASHSRAATPSLPAVAMAPPTKSCSILSELRSPSALSLSARPTRSQRTSASAHLPSRQSKSCSQPPVEIPVGRITYQDKEGAAVSLLHRGRRRRRGRALHLHARCRPEAPLRLCALHGPDVPRLGNPLISPVRRNLSTHRIRSAPRSSHSRKSWQFVSATSEACCTTSLPVPVSTSRAFACSPSKPAAASTTCASSWPPCCNARPSPAKSNCSTCIRSSAAAALAHPDNVFVEADGELLGGLPVTMEMAPEKLTLLIPQGVQP
jgi:hypothetical protein